MITEVELRLYDPAAGFGPDGLPSRVLSTKVVALDADPACRREQIAAALAGAGHGDDGRLAAKVEQNISNDDDAVIVVRS